MKLTDDIVSTLRCPPERKDKLVFDEAPKGFGVRVQANGPKIFIFRYKVAGVSRRISLGPFGKVTTAAARKEAERLRGQVRSGKDPWSERKKEAAETVAAEQTARAEKREAAFTVAALLDLYERKHVATLRPSTQRDVLSRLKLYLGPIKSRPVSAIDRREVAKVVDRAALAGATTARRVRDYARAMWNWGRHRGSLSLSIANPWDAAPAPGKDVPRERVLEADEIGLVWNAAVALEAPYGPLVRFLLLTLARREEVAAMTWGEVSPDLSAWTQPGARTKNGKPHVVALSEPAVAILREMLGAKDGEPLPALPKRDVHVFAVAGGNVMTSHSWVKRRLDKAIAAARSSDESKSMEPLQPWVFHDFRRSGVTWLAQSGFAPHVADRLLNHVQGTIRGVAAVYQRGDFAEERRDALSAWGKHVLRCARDSAELESAAASRGAGRRNRSWPGMLYLDEAKLQMIAENPDLRSKALARLSVTRKHVPEDQQGTDEKRFERLIKSLSDGGRNSAARAEGLLSLLEERRATAKTAIDALRAINHPQLAEFERLNADAEDRSKSVLLRWRAVSKLTELAAGLKLDMLD